MGPSAHAAQGDPVAAPDPPVRRLSGLRARRGPTNRAPEGGPDAPAHVGAAELADLVEAARDGDSKGFEALMRATYQTTYSVALRLTGNDDDARDVVQDTYLRVWRSLRRFRGDAQFTTWLYRVTANSSANLLAKRARHRTETLSEDDPVVDPRAEHDPEQRLAGSDERARIASALAQLPVRLRQVIVLRDIYDLAHGAIAKELGITEAAAKVRLHRARRRLREVLAAEGTVAGAGYATRTASEAEGHGPESQELEAGAG